MYWCPTVAVTNDYKLSGLQQHKYIILKLWRLEVQNGIYRFNTKVWARLLLSGDSRGESISLPFPASGSCLHSLACDPFLHPQSLQQSTFRSPHTLSLPLSNLCLSLTSSHLFLWHWPSGLPLLTLTLLPPSKKDPCGPHWAHPDNPRLSLYLKIPNLITPAKLFAV